MDIGVFARSMTITNNLTGEVETITDQNKIPQIFKFAQLFVNDKEVARKEFENNKKDEEIKINKTNKTNKKIKRHLR